MSWVEAPPPGRSARLREGVDVRVTVASAADGSRHALVFRITPGEATSARWLRPGVRLRAEYGVGEDAGRLRLLCDRRGAFVLRRRWPVGPQLRLAVPLSSLLETPMHIDPPWRPATVLHVDHVELTVSLPFVALGLRFRVRDGAASLAARP